MSEQASGNFISVSERLKRFKPASGRRTVCRRQRKRRQDLRKPTSLKNAHRKKRRQSHRRLRAGCLEDLGLIILPLNDERLGKTYNRPQQRDMRY